MTHNVKRICPNCGHPVPEDAKFA
ncbi:zinc-ribbon domain-containing protein [Blautia sp.]